MINKERVALATQRNQVRIKRSFQSSRCGIYRSVYSLVGRHREMGVNTWTVRGLGIVFLCIVLTGIATASELEATCRGNIETFDKKIVLAGVVYLLRYDISGEKAKIRFAGREFDAVVEKGASWKGRWIKNIEDNEYFSFLPDDGGTIKFQFEPNRWFSGNC